MHLVFKRSGVVGEELVVHMNLQQTFLHLGANLTKTTHFTSLRYKTYVAGKDSSPMCLIAMSCIIICLGIVT
jgi:hypothetical protein